MRRFAAVATVLAALLAPASAVAAPDLVVTSSAVTPNPAKPGDEVTLTWTVTNRGDAANASPIYTRLEVSGQTQWGIERVDCPAGALVSKPSEECRLDTPLGPGESATTTFIGSSPAPESIRYELVSYVADDPDHGNDNASGTLVIDGPPVTGGGGGGPAGDALALDDLQVSPVKVKRGGRVKVVVRASGPCTLTARLDRLSGGRWRDVPGSTKVQSGGGRETFRIGPKLGGRALAPGRYRIEVAAPGAEHVTATFTILKR